MFTYKINTFLKSDKIFLRYDQVAYQVCTAETNGDHLAIDWYDKHGKVF